MKNTKLRLGTATALIAMTLVVALPLAQDSQTKMTDEEKIADAMSAGPASITQDATILEWPSEPGGEFNVLREGSNGWSCIASAPASLEKGLRDPTCEDEMWLELDKAWLAGEKPNITKVGISYMLSGDAGMSNTDPFATEGTYYNQWHISGPHVMVLLPGLTYEGFSTDLHNGGPYVMWAGTPYAHIMVPVEPVQAQASEDVPEVVSGSVATDWTPPPLSPNVSVFYDGLAYPRGLKFDADGNLYVAEAGNGGDQEISADTCPDFESGFMPYFMGNSSRISRITPDGQRTTVIDAIPSARDPYDWTFGAADVALMDNTVYALFQAGGCSRAQDAVPNGILRGNPDGSWSTFADLSAVLHANWPPTDPMDDDMEPDGMPYGLLALNDKFYIVETNHGGLYEVNHDGQVKKLVDFTALYGHIAPSVIAEHDGNLYVGNIFTLPTVAGGAKVFKVSAAGKVEVFAEGFTNILGLTFDDQGRLYVLQMSNGETQIPALGTGRVVRVNNDGLRDVMATGLSYPAGMALGPDGALYISHYSYDLEPGRAHAGQGQILRIDVSESLSSRR